MGTGLRASFFHEGRTYAYTAACARGGPDPGDRPCGGTGVNGKMPIPEVWAPIICPIPAYIITWLIGLASRCLYVPLKNIRSPGFSPRQPALPPIHTLPPRETASYWDLESLGRPGSLARAAAAWRKPEQSYLLERVPSQPKPYTGRSASISWAAAKISLSPGDAAGGRRVSAEQTEERVTRRANS